MKHSAKLFTALAALALFAVVMVGIQDRGADAQSTDGTTGRVFLTNLNSCLTTQSNPPDSMACDPSGRNYVGSGGTLYTTVVEQDSESPHTVLNTIAANSDVLIVTVVDGDQDDSVPGSKAESVSFSAGTLSVITVPEDKRPITSTASEVEIVDSSGIAVSGAVVTQVQSASGVIITAGTQVGGVLTPVTLRWKYSDVNVLDVEAYSLNDRETVALTLIETGASTGVFEGEVKLIANVVIAGNEGIGTDATVPEDPPPAAGTRLRAELKVNSTSQINVKYSDPVDSSGDDDTVVRAKAQVETTPPTAVVSEPSDGANIQVRQPPFRGTVTDSPSGLALDSIILYIDQSDDPDNGSLVIEGGRGDESYSHGAGANTEGYEPAFANNPNDGASSVSWSVAEPGNLPTDVTAVQPDNEVDFILVAQDLAGNVGFSDADGTTSGVGVKVDDPNTDDNEGTNEPYVITIDQKFPVMVSAETGVAPDGDDEGTEPDRNNRRSIAITFDDELESADNGDFQITLDNDVILIPVGVQVSGKTVFAELDTDIPTNDTPLVRLQGGVSDLAGNTNSSGSVTATDSLNPTLTVELSGGSGTGTGANGPTGLTKNEILVTITSDEQLAGLPTVQVFVADSDSDADSDPDERMRLSVIARDSTTWTARATKSRLGSDAEISLVISAKDASVDANESTVGKANPADATSGATKFVLDSTKPALMTVDTSTSQGRPSIRIEFDEVVTVDSATIGDTVLVDDDTDLLASSDNKLFFYVPSEDLELGELKVEASATDRAGNSLENASYTLTVEERKAFDLGLFFGWNAVSVPSNPVDPDINAVFTNDSLLQVVAYDATDPESPWRIASRDPVSGAWTSTTDTPLRTIMAGPGYWVHSNSFDAQEIALAGPIEPGSGQAPRVEAIPTGAGWNFVGVIDTTKGKTQGASGASLVRSDGTAITADRYFASVDARRAFKYQATLQSFTEIALDGSSTVKIGDGIWVFINPLADGSTPAIAP